MGKIRLKLAIVSVLLVLPTVLAGTEYYCINNNTLIKTTSWNLTEDGTLTQYSVDKDTTCNWGCDNQTGTCYPPPIKTDMIIGAGILLLGLILFVLVPKIKGA